MNFLRNTWYVAARADEVGPDRLLARKFLDESVVLFRKRDGECVALADRCPHRFVPLHRGRLVDDTVQCGYHGLQFDASGRCVVAPFDDRIPASAKVRSYPLVERYSMLWIWMGEAPADPAAIPDFSCLVDPKRAQLHGYNHVAANYELVVDNLADLSHAHFLHGSFLDAMGLEKTQYAVEEVGDSIYSKFWFPGVPVPPIWNQYAGNTLSIVDRWSEIRWDAPCNVLLNAGVTPVGRPRAEGIDLLGVHLLTPESATTTHYFYCHCRGYSIDDPEVDKMVRNWQRVAFSEQDKPMLEVQQACLGEATDILAMKPVLLSSDAGAVRIRRRLKARIETEAG